MPPAGRSVSRRGRRTVAGMSQLTRPDPLRAPAPTSRRRLLARARRGRDRRPPGRPSARSARDLGSRARRLRDQPGRSAGSPATAVTALPVVAVVTLPGRDLARLAARQHADSTDRGGASNAPCHACASPRTPRPAIAHSSRATAAPPSCSPTRIRSPATSARTRRLRTTMRDGAARGRGGGLRRCGSPASTRSTRPAAEAAEVWHPGSRPCSAGSARSVVLAFVFASLLAFVPLLVALDLDHDQASCSPGDWPP